MISGLVIVDLRVRFKMTDIRQDRQTVRIALLS